MPDIVPGVNEIRVHRPDEFRVFYIAKSAEAVYVLRCFAKKTQATRLTIWRPAGGDTRIC